MVCCLALEVGREKAPASAGHMTTKHPEFVGVLNWHTITYRKKRPGDEVAVIHCILW